MASKFLSEITPQNECHANLKFFYKTVNILYDLKVLSNDFIKSCYSIIHFWKVYKWLILNKRPRKFVSWIMISSMNFSGFIGSHRMLVTQDWKFFSSTYLLVTCTYFYFTMLKTKMPACLPCVLKNTRLSCTWHEEEYTLQANRVVAKTHSHIESLYVYSRIFCSVAESFTFRIVCHLPIIKWRQ